MLSCRDILAMRWRNALRFSKIPPGLRGWTEAGRGGVARSELSGSAAPALQDENDGR
jgi:hypothetical protein